MVVCGGPVNVGAKSMGSKIVILGKDIQNLKVENLEEKKIMGDNILQKITQNRQGEPVPHENIKSKIINGPSRNNAEFPFTIVSKKLMIK